jgi:3-methyladenine DNA glycosylase AlkD
VPARPEPQPGEGQPITDAVAEVLAALEAVADPTTREEMGPRYGIHTPSAFGVAMRDIKAVAKPRGTDHALALALFDTGVYEARIVASLVADPAELTPAQMDAWCEEFDNWAVVDTVCFNLFDRSPHAWRKVEEWAQRDEEMVKRAGFALLWSLANHAKGVDDERFRPGIALVETMAGDGRHLVDKAIGMALRAIGKRRPGLRDEARELAERLAASDLADVRRIGKEAVRELR